MTLRLSPAEDEALNRLARQFRLSKNAAAAQAIGAVATQDDHAEFVRISTGRLLSRYADVLERLAKA